MQHLISGPPLLNETFLVLLAYALVLYAKHLVISIREWVTKVPKHIDMLYTLNPSFPRKPFAIPLALAPQVE